MSTTSLRSLPSGTLPRLSRKKTSLEALPSLKKVDNAPTSSAELQEVSMKSKAIVIATVILVWAILLIPPYSIPAMISILLLLIYLGTFLFAKLTPQVYLKVVIALHVLTVVVFKHISFERMFMKETDNRGIAFASVIVSILLATLSFGFTTDAFTELMSLIESAKERSRNQ